MRALAGSVRRQSEWWAFVAPALVLIVTAAIWPFLSGLYYSLTRWNGLDRDVEFVGLDNFVELFTADATFARSFRFTILYTLASVALTNAAALSLALVLAKPLRTARLLRAAFFVPNIVSLVVIGFIWKFVFSRAFEAFHEATGFGPFAWSWLGDPGLAFWSVVIVSVWQSVGFYTMIYIAGLQTIPMEIEEAADLDGVRGFARLRHVTLPLLMPSVTVCLFLSLANSLKVFDVIYTLTYGGPGDATRSLSLDIYTEAFVNNRFGYATAKSVVFVLLVLVVTVLQVRYFKAREVEA